MVSRRLGAVVGVAMALALTGCVKPATEGGSHGSASSKQTLQVKGSDTMVQMAQVWASEFGKTHPAIAVTVTGGGSNTGISALLNRTTDICNASREIKPEERKQAAQNGVQVKEFVVARDALSVIVNPSNPVNELTLAQLRDIFTGKVTNWKQLGGPDLNIVLNSRETSSGTYIFFQEHVLGKGVPYSSKALLQPSNTQIVDNVASDKGGIGYVGLGYVNSKVKSVKVKKDAASASVAASADNVRNGSYPLSRPLYEYTNGDPTGEIKTWLDWVLGADGQAVVKKLDFVPVKN